MLNYKDKSVCPEVVLGFSPPEVPALDLETNGVWTNKDWPVPVSLLQLRHTHNCLFLSPQTSHKVTFPQAYGSSFLQPACSQGAVVEWVCSEFLSLPHLWGMSEGKTLFILLGAYTETQLTYKLSTISILNSAHYQLTWPSQYPKWVN